MEYQKLQIKGLEDRHKITILIYLYKEGRKKKSDIYSIIPSNSKRADKLKELEEQGLIILDNRKFEHNTTYVELTDLGKEVSKKLYEIELFMSGACELDQNDVKDKIMEEEVQRRLKEHLEEEDFVSSSGAVLSVRNKEKEKD